MKYLAKSTAVKYLPYLVWIEQRISQKNKNILNTTYLCLYSGTSSHRIIMTWVRRPSQKFSDWCQLMSSTCHSSYYTKETLSQSMTTHKYMKRIFWCCLLIGNDRGIFYLGVFLKKYNLLIYTQNLAKDH